MSRTDNFIDFKTRQYLDTSEILDQVGATVRVLRRSNPAGEIGVDTEKGNPSFLRKMVAYIEAWNSAVMAKRLDQNFAQGMKYTYFGITADDDVRVGDVWDTGEVQLSVGYVDRMHSGKSEVGLEIVE